jgi:predicted DNA binding CopG/RHH family protein
MSEVKVKKLPVLLTDEDAQRFIATADLSDYDLSGFKPMRFEFAKKDERINMRLPRDLLAAVKTQAKLRELPYQRYIREVLERAVQGDSGKQR